MQGHRTASGSTGVAQPSTPQHDHQRRLVLELVVDPPVDGDRPRLLARRLQLSLAEIEAASEALVAVGLVERCHGRLFASRSALALDELWPIGM